MEIRCRPLAIAFVASIGSSLFGVDIGYIAPILECPNFKRDVAHLPDWRNANARINGFDVGLIVSIFSIGCVFSSFPVVSNYFVDGLGRRLSIVIGSLLGLVGAGAQALANSLSIFVAGRFVSGLAIGLLGVALQLYLAEVAPPNMRGFLVGMHQFMITVGIFLATLLDQVLLPSDEGWRLAIGVQLLLALILSVSMVFMPPSPRWLVLTGREEEALSVLKYIREDDATEEHAEIIEDVKTARQLGDPMWTDCFTGYIGRLLAVGVSITVLGQLCGMNAFMYFGPRIFHDLGLEKNFFQTMICLVNVLATIPGMLMLDYSGRRILLVWSTFGMFLSCLVMGALGGVDTSSGNLHPPVHLLAPSTSKAVLVAAAIMFFIINFAYGYGCVGWAYCSEMFPLKYRSRCVGITTTSCWVANWAIAMFTPIMLEALGFKTFFVFMIMCAIAFGLALWLPETKGVPLELVEHIFLAKFGMEKASIRSQGVEEYGTLEKSLH